MIFEPRFLDLRFLSRSLLKFGLAVALLWLPRPAGSEQAQTSPVMTSVRTLGWLRSKDCRLTDEFGRQWLLRGTNAKIDGLFDCSFNDGRKPTEIVPAFDPQDAERMVGFGFNLVRLCINWSGLEPEEGRFSEAFLRQMDEIAQNLGQAGLYVLIDFHQDAFSKEIGEDGAPLWAILPRPDKLLQGPVYECEGLPCPCESLDARRTSKPVLDAFKSFFEDVDGIQGRFMPAWKTVAARYADKPWIAGFEAMNEPVAMHVTHGNDLIEAFHERCVKALREVNSRHAYWLEPEVVARNIFCGAPLRKTPPPDDNLVYAPHMYPGLCLNVPKKLNTYEEFVTALTQTFDGMVEEARSWGAPAVIGEWCCGTEREEDYPEAINALSEARQIGLAQWSWKGYGSRTDTDSSGGCYRWVYDQKQWVATQPGGERLYFPYAMAVPGKLIQHAFDRQTRRLTVTFEAKGGEGPPLLYVPNYRYPSGAVIELDGKSVEVPVDPATRRALVPWEGQPGSHVLTVRPTS